MNIDFANYPGFSWYIVFLFIGGAMMAVLATPVLPRVPVGTRVINGIIAAAMLGYGFYLNFIFEGGTYRMFFYVFVIPVLAIFRTFSEVKKAKEERTAHEQRMAEIQRQQAMQPPAPLPPTYQPPASPVEETR